MSGNAAEQQLTGLEGSTTYTVTVTSQLGSQESSPATTTFTTNGGKHMSCLPHCLSINSVDSFVNEINVNLNSAVILMVISH